MKIPVTDRRCDTATLRDEPDDRPSPYWGELGGALLRWHDPTRRRLAFRTASHPGDRVWGVLLSEVMSQQTQAERAATAWKEFTRRWPTPAAMAATPRGEIIAAWRGLGYNRRAVNLHRCAEAITEQHAGVVPESRAELEDLPGIGPYTAAAILAFGYGQPILAIDTNTARVLARLMGSPLTARQTKVAAEEAVAGLIEARHSPEGEAPPPASSPRGGIGAALSEAMMDLGASLCTAREARCALCPISMWCGWRGDAGCDDPAAKSAHRPTRQGRFSGSRRQARGLLVEAMRSAPISLAKASEVLEGASQRSGAAISQERTAEILAALCKDGLVERHDDNYGLTGWAG